MVSRGRHVPPCMHSFIILGILIHNIYICNLVIYDVIHYTTKRHLIHPSTRSFVRSIDRSIDRMDRDALGRGVPFIRRRASRSVSRSRCVERSRIRRRHRYRLSLDVIARDDDRGRCVGDDARMASSSHPAPPPGRVMTHRMVVTTHRMTHRMMMMSYCPR